MEAHVQQKKEKQRPGLSKDGELIGPLSDAFECPVSIEYELDGQFRPTVICESQVLMPE